MDQVTDVIFSQKGQIHHITTATRFALKPISPGPSFIKPDQLDPWINDQLRNTLLSTMLPLQLPNFVSCGRACPSHMTKNLVTVGALLTGEWFLFDPWSMDQADLVWQKWGLGVRNERVHCTCSISTSWAIVRKLALLTGHIENSIL